MKIIVSGPPSQLKNSGGVANHIHGLFPYFTEDVRINGAGKRSSKDGSGKFWIPWDVIKIFFKLMFIRPDFLWVNPSIGMGALRRDFLLANVAHLLGVKVAIFIHGFDLKNFEKIDKIWLRDNLNKASLIFVLASDFKNRLEEIGVTTPIELTTTKVEDSLVDGFGISTRNGKTGDLLFLARLEKNKGIYETIETFKILKKDFPNLTLNIVGGGSEEANVRDLVKRENLQGVTIAGRLSGDSVTEAYKNARILFLITTHGEGMPTTVLEGMAFGLPVITRPVGGLTDFFENGKMGFIDSTLDPVKIADGVRPFLQNPELTRQVAQYNHRYAMEHFMASKVACSLEKIFAKYNTK